MTDFLDFCSIWWRHKTRRNIKKLLIEIKIDMKRIGRRLKWIKGNGKWKLEKTVRIWHLRVEFWDWDRERWDGMGWEINYAQRYIFKFKEKANQRILCSFERPFQSSKRNATAVIKMQRTPLGRVDFCYSISLYKKALSSVFNTLTNRNIYSNQSWIIITVFFL